MDFIYIKGNSKKSLILENANYRRCCRENRPHAIIRLHKKWASISIDLITCDKSLKNPNDILDIMREYIKTFDKRINVWWGAGQYTSISTVRIDDADLLMKKILSAMKLEKTKPWSPINGQ